MAKDYNAIYKANGGELILAKRNGKNYLMFVRLKPSKDGDFYSVSTAYKSSKRTIDNRLKKEKVSLLWESTALLSESTIETPVFAHRSDDKDGSDEPNVTCHNKKTRNANTTRTDIGTSKSKDDTASLDNASDKSITPKSKVDKIVDFGETLHGANKHNYTHNEKLNENIDVKAAPLSKSFP